MKKITRLYIGVACLAVGSGCAINGTSIDRFGSYPTIGDNPDTLLTLRSNIDETVYSIEGDELGRSDVLKVVIDGSDSYRVTARPEGYVEKIDFIQPPYYDPFYLNFTFMIGERISEADQASDSHANSAVNLDWRPPSGSTRDAEDVALIIANQAYESEGVPDVEYAARDATAMQRFLKTTFGFREENIVVVEDATKGDMETWFGTTDSHRGRLSDFLREGVSEVFIYYVGHGAPDLEMGGAFLVPVDSDPSYVRNSGYSLELLYRNLGLLEAESVTVVLDTCFSGRSHGGFLFDDISPSLVEIQDQAVAPPEVNVFTSARDNQVSVWYEEKQHSLFTYLFLQGLEGDSDLNGDGTVTMREMAAYLEERVPYLAARVAGVRQTPEFTGKNAVLATFQ